MSYAVSAAGETTGSLTTNYWYDPAGNLIKSQAGGTQEFTKYQYDSLGQVTETCVGYAGSGDANDYTRGGQRRRRLHLPANRRHL